MRAHGCIDSGTDLGANGHACWVFDDHEEFVATALEYLTDGLRDGQRIVYVGSESVEEQREFLAPLGDVGSLVDNGMLALFELTDLYKAGEPVDPETQIGIYLAATEAALADGYTGLRVAAQATELALDPATCDAHIRWESFADRYASERPLSALCGYRRDALPDRVLSDLAAVHPASNGGPPDHPFHLFSDSGDLVLSGEVDLFSAADLDRVFDFASGDTEKVSLNLDKLEFIDHHGLVALAGNTQRFALTGGCTIHNAPPVVDRLCDLLELKL